MLDTLTDWVTSVVETFGYGGVAFLVLIENVFPPIPSELVLALAGFTASQGESTVPGMIAASTAGSLGGALLLYGAAAWLGSVRLRNLLLSRERWLRITGRDIDRAERWFDRWAALGVLVCRCIPLVRSLISVPAGLRRMPILPFVVLTTIGSLIWNSVFVTSGYLLGAQWHRVADAADYAQYLVLASGAALAVVGAVVWKGRGQARASGRSRVGED